MAGSRFEQGRQLDILQARVEVLEARIIDMDRAMHLILEKLEPIAAAITKEAACLPSPPTESTET